MAPRIAQAQAPTDWPAGFELVQIQSPTDTTLQPAYFRRASKAGQPLAVVLHTWSGDYTQRTHSLAEQVAARNWNYIHPDFRGPNRHPDACCSEKALTDIDAAIAFALANSEADSSAIHVLGASGGGYATLCHFMNGNQAATSYSAWVPISDLPAWYEESLGRGNRYADDIRACTGSGATLHVEEARKRSPLFMEMPDKMANTTLNVFAGIHTLYCLISMHLCRS